MSHWGRASRTGIPHYALAAFLASAALGCAATSELPKSTSSSRSDSIAIADLSYANEIGRLELASTESYDYAELGVRIRYADPMDERLLADVFVYPITLPDLFSLSEILELEQSHLDQEIEQFVASQGQTVKDIRVSPHTPEPGGALRAGLLSRRLFRGPEFDSESYAFLGVSRDLFIKLRMTAPAPLSQSRFESFVAGVSASFRVTNREPPELNVTVTATTVETVAKLKTCLIAAWIVYGAKLEDALAHGEYLDTFEREAAARAAALDIWETQRKDDSVGDCNSPVFAAMAKAKEQDYFAEYVWQAYRHRSWTPPPELDSAGFEAWAIRNLPQHDPVDFPGILIRWKDRPAQ